LIYSGIFFLTKLNTRDYLNHFLPFDHDISIHKSSESELKTHPISNINYCLPLFINNRVNSPKLNCKTTAIKPLFLPKSDLSLIPHFPLKTHLGCLDNPAYPFSKQGAVSIFTTNDVRRADLVFLINYSPLEPRICILISLDPRG
jgi:hypothetical protein